ncbi:hypothetical protein D3C80_1661970 [compost metagenome]
MPILRAFSRCSGGSLLVRIDMNIRLSMPSTTSMTIKVIRATQAAGSVNRGRIVSIGGCCPFSCPALADISCNHVCYKTRETSEFISECRRVFMIFTFCAKAPKRRFCQMRSTVFGSVSGHKHFHGAIDHTVQFLLRDVSVDFSEKSEFEKRPG